MKKYNVTVNGTAYEITLEVVDAADVKTTASPAPAAAPAAAPAPAPAAAPAGGETVAAPMPGNILAVNVQNGSAVKKGDVLMILEAMKMENEIMAPCDGTIASVNVTKGSTVETGAVLCVIA
jgi:biotin carboxyl carrier protein